MHDKNMLRSIDATRFAHSMEVVRIEESVNRGSLYGSIFLVVENLGTIQLHCI